MGLFKFIKDAGAKLFGGGAQAATPDALKQTVESHGFDANKLDINMEGDRVKLSGQAMTQEEAEKIILSLGNTIGVAEVDTGELQVQQPSLCDGDRHRLAVENRNPFTFTEVRQTDVAELYLMVLAGMNLKCDKPLDVEGVPPESPRVLSSERLHAISLNDNNDTSQY